MSYLPETAPAGDTATLVVPASGRTKPRLFARTRPTEVKERGVISVADRKRRTVRVWLFVIQAVALVCLIIGGLGPLIWSAKASVTSTQDIIGNPMGIFAAPNEWGNLATAWTRAQIGESLLNTLSVALGSTLCTLVISVLAAYIIAVMKPRWAPIFSGAILATLFVPGVISLVPLYLTVLNLPGLNVNLINTFWAVWLPAGASAFNVVVLQRFFTSIPAEILEAARIDGAGPLRVLWAIVLPLSRPILGVVALLSAVAAWKDYLWPMLVLPNRDLQPVSVILPGLSDSNTPMSVQMAAVFLALLIPVIAFVIFQKQFLRGVGTAGGVKG